MKQVLQPRKLLITLLLAISTFGGLMAQVNNTQGFETNAMPPTGWTLGNTNGNALWRHATLGTYPTCTPHSGTGMAEFKIHSNVGSSAGRTQALITPVIDYSDLAGNTATFSLWVYRDTGVASAADSITIAVNTIASDSLSTWIGSIARNININLPNTEDSSGWYQYTFNVPATFNTNTNYIIINGTSQGGNNIFIDDVSWVSYPQQCSGKPNAGTIDAGTGIICGDSGTTTLSLSGGVTAAEAGISYQWLSATSASGPWTYFDSVPSINTGVISATTYYQFVVSCSNSGLSDTTAVSTVTVSSAPAPVITITPATANYCVGAAPIPLAATGATIYSWSPATGLNVTGDSDVLASPTVTTRYTVTGTDISGCSASARVNVNVRQAPVLTVSATPDTVCAGDSVTLTANTTGFVNGAVYTWFPDSITGATVTVAPALTTPYIVNLTSTNGCPAADTITVDVNQLSVAAFGYSANGLAVTFSDSSVYATTWNWRFGDGDTSISENPTHTYSADGTDTVQLITTGLCNPPDTTTQVITVFAEGVKAVSANPVISVYPNPAESYAVVEFSLNEPEAKLTVINMLGEAVATYEMVAIGNKYKQQIDLSKMAAGIYTVRVVTAGQSVEKELVRQ